MKKNEDWKILQRKKYKQKNITEGKKKMEGWQRKQNNGGKKYSKQKKKNIEKNDERK